MRVLAPFVLVGGTAAIRQQDELAGEDTLQAVLKTDADEEWKKWREQRGCPKGLEPFSDSFCAMPDPQIWAPSAEEAFDLGWTVPSPEHSLTFRKKGGAFMLEFAFIEELVSAMGDLEIAGKIYNGFIESETQVNPKFKDQAKDFIEKVIAFGTAANEEVSAAKGKPGFTDEYVGLVAGYFAQAKQVMGMGEKFIDAPDVFEWLSKKVGLAEDVFNKVVPFAYLGNALKAMWEKEKQSFVEKAEHVDTYLTRLTLRSACVANATYLEKEVLEAVADDWLADHVFDTCGAEVSVTLAKQMQRTNVALAHLFQSMATIGQCMIPRGESANAMVQCANNLYTPLREVRGESGILFEALSFAALYADVADELLIEPQYGHIIEEKFGGSLVEAIQSEANELREMNVLWNLKGDEEPEVRAEACLSMVATHRAFERTFQKLAKSMEVWLRTWGRKRFSANVHTSWQPCKKVFPALIDAAAPFCEAGGDLMINVTNACDAEAADEAGLPLWD